MGSVVLTKFVQTRQNWLESSHFAPHVTFTVRQESGRETTATYEDGAWFDEDGELLDDVREWQLDVVQAVNI